MEILPDPNLSYNQRIAQPTDAEVTDLKIKMGKIKKPRWDSPQGNWGTYKE